MDDQEHAPFHVAANKLTAGVDHIRASPQSSGTLEMVVRRPAPEEREVLETAELSAEFGVVGDSWITRGSRRTDDGSSHPDMQLNVMNSRVVQLVAGSRDRWPLAGDQLFVDMDLSDHSMPAWTKLAIGDAVIEITDQPHNGCAKFRQRFGADALRFISSDIGKELNMRGRNARVITPGTVRPGDQITRL